MCYFYLSKNYDTLQSNEIFLNLSTFTLSQCSFLANFQYFYFITFVKFTQKYKQDNDRTG
jgi:hypothetical protein